MRSLFTIVIATFALQAQARWVSFDNNQKNVAEVKSVTQTATGYKIQVTTGGFDYNAVQTKNGTFGQMILTKGHGTLTEIGRPQIPVVRQMVELPTGAAQVVVTFGERKTFVLKSSGILEKIAPVQESSAKLPNAPQPPFQMDAGVYQSDLVYPNFEARIAYKGSVRGHQLAMIEIAPVQYNAARGELKYAPEMTVEVINQENPEQLPPKKSARSFDSAYGKNVAGYSVSKDSETAEGLLILVGEGFETSAHVKAITEAKKARGFNVTVKNAKDVGNTPESIRAEVQRLYKQSPSLAYVLLIGDVEQLAAYRGTQLTNNYYAAIDKGTYDEDATFPDLSVGRLTVKTDEELSIVATKLVKYDARKFKDTAWKNRMAFLATDDKWQVAEGTHNYVIDTYTKNLGYRGNFPSVDEKGGDKLYPITHNATSADVMTASNDGRVLISYSGHGLTTGWDGPRMTQSDVTSLNHPEAIPYVMSHACLTGSFGESYDSFSETWLKHPAGAVGFWGTSNLSYWDEDDILERVFFDGVYKNGIKNVGPMNLYGLQGVREYYNNGGRTRYYYEIYNLMGDPTTELMLP